MSTSSSNQTVFVLGGTGRTGSSVVNGLLEAKKYVRLSVGLEIQLQNEFDLPFPQNVIVGVRPSSLSKPEVSKLRERGVEIRAIELSDSPAELDAALKGVDTVVSTTYFTEIDKQVYLVDAAKRVGVKRFVPDDWATPCVRGVWKFYEQVRVERDC